MFSKLNGQPILRSFNFCYGQTVMSDCSILIVHPTLRACNLFYMQDYFKRFLFRVSGKLCFISDRNVNARSTRNKRVFSFPWIFQGSQDGLFLLSLKFHDNVPYKLIPMSMSQLSYF